MNPLKIRCSAIGKIVHFDKSTYLTEKEKGQLEQLEAVLVAPPVNKLTDHQKAELEKLEVKEKAGTLTPNQTEKIKTLRAKQSVKPSLNKTDSEKLETLRKKRDAKTQLSKGAKTYIQDVFYGEKFDFIKAFTSKQTEKGDAVESRGIDQVLEFLGLPMAVKNEKWFQNEFIHGTPDVDLSVIGLQMDHKAPYMPNALGTFNEEVEHDHEWQMHGYNWLLEIDTAIVARVLLNPPESIIEKEAWIRLKDSGLTEMNDDFKDQVRQMFDFEGKRPIEDRLRLYVVKTEEHHVETIKTSVELTREYWKELEAKWENKNSKEIEMIREFVKSKLAT